MVGSMYAIVILAEDSEIKIYSVTYDFESEHHEMKNELAAKVYYDVLNYEGCLVGCDEVTVVYAVKLNLDREELQGGPLMKSKQMSYALSFRYARVLLDE